MNLFYSMRTRRAHIPTHAANLLIFLALSFCACSQNGRGSQSAPRTAQQTTERIASQSANAAHNDAAHDARQTAAHNTNLVTAQTAGHNQNVRICASVPTIEDEYIPLFHTNVFIRTDDDVLADNIERELARMHKLFDAHHYYHDDESAGILKNLKIVNEHIALGKSVHAGDEFASLLADAIHLMHLTRGAFNIFLAPVSALYAGKFSSFPIEQSDPDANTIEEALRCVLNADEATECIAISGGDISFFPRAERQTARHAAMPQEAQRVTSAVRQHTALQATEHAAHFDYALDFGAIAKGAAAHKISMLHPDGTFLLSMGSSTLVSRGGTYRIGIASPHYKTLALLHIDLPSGMALSTSGTTNSYYILADDSRIIRCHILDSRTGYSNNWWWAVIVVSDNAFVTDAMSTALFNVGDEAEIAAIIADVQAAYNCELEACFVKDENRKEKTVSLVMTRGFASYVYSEYKGMGIIGTKLLAQ
ncbi:MAG: FAD:protein FMN transferase [Treponema sp.]|nr:FAD:protein FMN transferase [Treponema sp.]